MNMKAKSTPKYQTVVDRLRALAAELEVLAIEDRQIAERGSSVTSLAEDVTIGAVGEERARIAAILQSIIKLAVER